VKKWGLFSGTLALAIALSILLFNVYMIPPGWHLYVASLKNTPPAKLNVDLIIFRRLSYFIAMHIAPKCSADILDMQTGEPISDDTGALFSLTHMYGEKDIDSVNISAVEALLKDRLKHCAPDLKSPHFTLTPLQQSILYHAPEAVQLLLDAGANPKSKIDYPGKWIDGLDSLEMAKRLQNSKNLAAHKSALDEIVSLLEKKMVSETPRAREKTP
jgi:hypothetical protein